MLSNTLPNPRDQKLLELAEEVADHLKNKRYAHAERLLQRQLTPSGLLSEHPKKGSRPLVEAIFFEHPKKFREMFSADKPAEEQEDLYFTLLETIKNTKLARMSLFEVNTDMKQRVLLELDTLKRYAEVLEKQGCSDKPADLMEIYNELQPKVASFNINMLKVEAAFNERTEMLYAETLQSKQPYIERRQQSRERALQQRLALEDKKAPEPQLQKLDNQLMHLELDSLDEIQLDLKNSEEALLIDRDRRRAMQKLPAAEDKLKSLNFKLEIMETLHKHDETLNQHRTSKFIRGFVNGISLILLGLPWLAHRALTGNWLFFNKTSSQEKIEQIDRTLKLAELPTQMRMTN